MLRSRRITLAEHKVALMLLCAGQTPIQARAQILIQIPSTSRAPRRRPHTPLRPTHPRQPPSLPPKIPHIKHQNLTHRQRPGEEDDCQAAERGLHLHFMVSVHLRYLTSFT